MCGIAAYSNRRVSKILNIFLSLRYDPPERTQIVFEYFHPWDQPDVMNLCDKTTQMLPKGVLLVCKSYGKSKDLFYIDIMGWLLLKKWFQCFCTKGFSSIVGVV